MNEGVLIRYLGKWMTFRRPLGLGLRGGVRWGELRFVGGLEPQLRTSLLTLNFVFGRVSEGLWKGFYGFWEGFGSVLEVIWVLQFNIFRSHFIDKL